MSVTKVRGTSSVESAARKEFTWRANTPTGVITIIRTGLSSPVFIQQNN